MYASLFGPELHNGLLHLVVVPVCFPSTTSATVSLGVFSEIVQFDPAWPPFAPPPAVHVQAVNSAQWSMSSAESVSDMNCQVSGPPLCYTGHELLWSKTSYFVLDLDLTSEGSEDRM